MAGKKEKARFVFFKYVPNKAKDIKAAEPESDILQQTEGMEHTTGAPEKSLDSQTGTDFAEEVKSNTEAEQPAEAEQPVEAEQPAEVERSAEAEQQAGSECPEYPDVPECPDEPECPDYPDVPDYPDIPECPEYPDIPECPEPPEEPEEPEGPCPENAVMHVVKKGDTFWKLAKKYNTTVEAIVDANPDVDPLNLQIGQTICIPVGIPGAKG